MTGLRLSALLLSLIALTTFCTSSAGAGTFKNPELINTSYDPQGIAAADLNGDGRVDLLYVDGIGSLTLHSLLGNGDGTFSHVEDKALPDGVCSSLSCVINLGDVNHDGIVDVIVGGRTVSGEGIVVALIGNGDGTFAAPVVSSLAHGGSNGGNASFNAGIAIGDINGDGATDLVVGDPMSATLYVLLGDGSGRFSIGSTATYYYTGLTISYLYDLNGDGHPDIVLNDLVGAQTYVSFSNGDGTFKPAVVFLSFAVLFADMDGDGHPDIVGRLYPDQVQIFKGKPDGTFGSASVIATGPDDAQLAGTGDFNRDGAPDLLFMTPVGVGVALAEGNLTYGALSTSVAGKAIPGYYQFGLAQGDFNNDGRQDIAMAVNGGVLVLLGNGDGSFASADSYDVGNAVGTAVVADFNGDKHPDIALTVSASYPRILSGNGSGSFTLTADQNQSYTTQDPSESMLAGDFNGDGKMDLDIVERTSSYPYGQPFVLLGNGNSTFANPTAISSDPALVADVNNDGRSDMVTLYNASILSLLGQANGSFSQVTTPLLQTTYGVAAIQDLNRDGKVDLLTYEFPTMRVWLGKGNGGFTQGNLVDQSPAQQFNAEYVTVADLDGDGNADIVVVPYPNQISVPFTILIYYGNGDGTFPAGVYLPMSHGYTQLVIADVDQDNKPDLVLSDGAGIAVMKNLGGRNFGPEQHFVAGQRIAGLSVADVNGDGFPDIVVANESGTTATVLLNQPGSNAIDGAPSNGLFTISPEPAQYGQPVTLSIAMSVASGPVPTGSVSFNVDGAFIASLALVNGKASRTYSGALMTGIHTFIATYEGDKTYAPESFSLLHTVTPPIYATTTVLAASPTTLLTSQTVRITATVSSTVTVPAGAITFLDGVNTLGSRNIYQGPVVTFDTNLLSAGVHNLTAVYHGYQEPFDQQVVFQPSTSAPVTVTVNATGTSTALSASTQSPTAGSVVTFTASVNSAAGSPFGGATFYDGATSLGTSSLKADGSCTFSTASLSVGTHNIKAAFNANATFAGSTSSTTVVTVSPVAADLAPTLVRLAVSAQGDRNLLTASVNSATGTPTGEIVFLSDGQIIGQVVADSSGEASLSVPALTAGAHILYASLAGDPQFAAGVSPALVEQLPPAGRGFDLAVSASELDLNLSPTTELTVVPESGFQSLVQFTCADGVPSGYECTFSPDSLYGGSSVLRLQRMSSPILRHASLLLYTPVAGVLLVCLAVPRRRRLLAGALIMISVTALMTGCGNPSPARPQMTVLSVRASAGTGAATVIHSTQILLKVH